MKVAILDDYQSVALALADWEGLEAEISVFTDTVSGPELVARLQPFDVICLMRERTPFPAALFAALPALRLLVTSGKRNLSIDLQAAQKCGVVVCGTQTRGPATSQMAMALILAASRNLVSESMALVQGDWQTTLGRDLEGLTLGLVGLGRLGGQMVHLARPFGMNILAWSEHLSTERCLELQVERADSLELLLQRADVVSIHLVLSERTRGLIGADRLQLMKKDALLVNTSRGPIVPWQDLLAALKAGCPACAAVDVFDEEPLPVNHPLRDPQLIAQGRLVLSPHIGYVSRQTYRLFYRQMVEDIIAWRQGKVLRQLLP